MKRIISLLVCIAILAPCFSNTTPLFAAAFNDDGVITSPDEIEKTAPNNTSESEEDINKPTWEYIYYGEKVILTAYNGNAADIYIPSQIVGDDGVKHDVHSTDYELFAGNTAINSVTFGKGIVSIGDNCFMGCTGLVCVVLNEDMARVGTRAFKDCSKLNSIILYDSVSVGNDAFANCPELTIWCNEGTPGYNYAVNNNIPFRILNPDAQPEIHTENGIEYYIMNGQAYAVACDDSMASVVIPANIKGNPVVDIGNIFMDNKTVTDICLPNSIRNIDSYCFYGAASLAKVDIPDLVTEIGEYAFYGCTSLKEITLPDNLKTISGYAFRGCTSLVCVELPYGIETLAYHAFENCSSLKEIIIPDSVVNISDYLFANCYSLSSVTLSKNINRLYSHTFLNCRSLKEMTIPSSIKSGGYNTFTGCSSLTKLTMEEGAKLTDFGDNPNYKYLAFDSNTLKHLEIAGSQGIVRRGVFNTQNNVEYLTMGEGITAISADVFSSASGLKYVTIPRSVTSMTTTSFSPNTVLYVHEGSYAHDFAMENELLYHIINDSFEPSFTEIDGVTYFVAKNEASAVAFDQSRTEVILPEYVNGKPLTSLNRTFYNCRNLISVTVPDTVQHISSYTFCYCSSLKNVTLSSNITKINNCTFYECYSLTEISTPDGITEIGSHAFYRCTSLKNIVLPEGLARLSQHCFDSCNALVSIVLPDTLTSAEEGCFSGCSSLESIKIPQSMTVIPADMFNSCYALKDISIPSTVEKIGESAFCNCNLLEEIVLPEITEIPSSLFYRCFALKNLTIPESVTKIGSNAFSYCGSLTSLNIPVSVTSIGASAFSYCSMIAEIDLPDSLEFLGNNAFSYCTSIEKISLPPKLRFINSTNGDRVGDWFTGCTNLTEVILEEGIGSIDIYLFNGCNWVKEVTVPSTLHIANSLLKSPALERLNLCEGVSYLSQGAFIDCPSLNSVILPRSISTMFTDSFAPTTLLLVYENSYAHRFAEENDLFYFIYDGINEPEYYEQDNVIYCILSDKAYAVGYTGNDSTVTVPGYVKNTPVTELKGTFNNCSDIVNVNLPDTLEIIGAYTFNNCTSLESVNIPEGVIYIGDNAFRQATKLKSIVFPNTVTAIGSYAFSGCSSITSLHIPSSVELTGRYTFESCTSLTELIIEKGLVTIGNHAFKGCSSIVSVYLPESVETIGDEAFMLCSKLTYFTFNTGLRHIGTNAFKGCALTNIETPNTLEYIGNEAFSAISALKTVKLCGNDTIIGYRAFHRCNNLKEVTLSRTIKEVGEQAFSYCANLSTLNLSSKIELIGYEAFFKCSALKTVYISSYIDKISGSAFADCTALTEIAFSKTYGLAGEIAASAFANCISLKKIILPPEATCLNSTFSGCTSLEEAFVNVQVKIMNGTFSDCTALTTIKLHEGLTSIGRDTFKNCVALRTIYMPSTLTSIDEAAFEGCNAVLLVNKDSYAHRFAQENGLRHFVLYRLANPEINYGTEVSGNVRYTDHRAAAYATVEIYYEDGQFKESVTADENGSYSFTYTEVGKYTVKATDNCGRCGITQISVKRKNVFDVFLSGDTELVLKNGWNISGRVNDFPSVVTLTDTEGMIIEKVTSENGSFFLENVPNGEYILKAESARGSVRTKITVFNSHINEIVLNTDPSVCATLTGNIFVMNREGLIDLCSWAHIALYNADGVCIGHTRSDENGAFTFEKLSEGEYFILAESDEMRSDTEYEYERSYKLTGYGYSKIDTSGIYTTEDIILLESSDSKAQISGAAALNGEPIKSEIILRDIYNNEIARYLTGDNGRYSFINIPDGIYMIVADSDIHGAGSSVAVVRDGKVYGKTDITICKLQKINEIETAFATDVPENLTEEDTELYRNRIAQEKNIYDSLSSTEKEMLSVSYVQRLEQYCRWLSASDESEGVSDSGLILSPDELEQKSRVSFELSIEKIEAPQVNTSGIETDADFINTKIGDAAENDTLVQYYDITMSKTVNGVSTSITNVLKDTDTTGSLLITIPIPEEYRGYERYSVIHEHNGEVVTLVDLDDDPDTVTVKVDNFSTFALAASNKKRTAAIIDPPEITEINNYTITINNLSDIKEIRYAIGHYTTGTEVRNAEKNQTLSASLVNSYTVDGIMTYEVPWVGEYTFWVRLNDGSAYFLYADVNEIDPYLVSDGLRLTVKDFGENYKDMWIAEGTWSSYSEIKNYAAVKYQAAAAKLSNYFANHDFTYTTANPGAHTVLIRYNDGTQNVLHIDLIVDVPTFDVNGLRVTVGNIPGIKVIRSAYGEYNSVAEIKKAAGVRNFNNKTAIKDADSYKIQYRDNGVVTIIVEYATGYKHIEHVNIAQKLPTFKQDGNSVTIGDLDDMVIIRYAEGVYTTSAEIKRAEDSRYLKPSDITNGYAIIDLPEGSTYTICVQYDDESYNYFTVVV